MKGFDDAASVFEDEENPDLQEETIIDDDFEPHEMTQDDYDNYSGDI